MQESGWHHLVSIQIPLRSQMKGSFAIILSPLQIYCRDFKGRTFLEIKWLGSSKGRNIPNGQMSFIRYWAQQQLLLIYKLPTSGQPKQQLYQYMKSGAFMQHLNE